MSRAANVRLLVRAQSWPGIRRPPPVPAASRRHRACPQAANEHTAATPLGPSVARLIPRAVQYVSSNSPQGKADAGIRSGENLGAKERQRELTDTQAVQKWHNHHRRGEEGIKQALRVLQQLVPLCSPCPPASAGFWPRTCSPDPPAQSPSLATPETPRTSLPPPGCALSSLC